MKTTSSKKLWKCASALFLALSYLACPGSVEAGENDIPAPVTIVSSSDLAPLLSPNVVIESLSAPVVNLHGQMAFRATLSGSGVNTSNDSAIYVYTGTSPDFVIREGDTDPAFAGALSVLGALPNIADDGSLAFLASQTGVGSADGLILFRDPAGGMHVIAAEGGAAPGGSGTFTANGINPLTDAPPVIQPGGFVAFDAPVQDVSGPVLDGLFLFESGMLQLIAKEGGLAASNPDLFFGSLVSSGDVFPNIGLSNDGTLSFLASVATPGGFGSNGIFSNSAAGTMPLVLEGDVLPGYPNKRLFGSAGGISAGPAGRLVFRANVTKGNGDPVFGDAGSFFFKPHHVSVEALLRPKPLLSVDDLIKGLPTNGRVLDMGEPLCNAFGRSFIHIFFNGQGVKSSSDTGLAQFKGNNGILVCREGRQVAGLPPDTLFGGFSDMNLVMNNLGQAGFLINLMGNAVTPGVDDKALVVAQKGDVQVVARLGQMITASNTTRTITGINVAGSALRSGGADGKPRWMNDRGQIAALFNHAGGSSVVLCGDGDAVNYQPDVVLVTGTGARDTFGNGVYSDDGSTQTREAPIAPATTGTFTTKIQNDGSAADTIFITGDQTDAAKGYTIEYFDGATNVTAQVTGGGLNKPLGPGEEFELRVEITVAAADAKGSKKVKIKTRSTSDPAKVDVLIIKAKRDP